uniref:FERM domain-containing protein n=1 Tax=Steinernema glaseri TaxID=37863 RepID=A0A1I7XX55_9BILA
MNREVHCPSEIHYLFNFEILYDESQPQSQGAANAAAALQVLCKCISKHLTCDLYDLSPTDFNAMFVTANLMKVHAHSKN